jgi:hypothetical protein
MTCLRAVVLTVLLVVGSRRAARGEEPTPKPPATRESVLEAGLQALRVRMEARMKEVEILREQGKTESALLVLREVEAMYPEAVENLRRLVDGADRAPRRRPADGSDLLDECGPMDLLGQGAFPNRWGRVATGRSSGGGRSKDVSALQHSLSWLAAHQSPDGAWRAAEFDRWCDGKENAGPRPDGRGEPRADVAVTALALTAFLAAGYTHRDSSEFARVIARGLGFLRAQQLEDGSFDPRRTIAWAVHDSIATLVFVEAYGQTGSHALRDVAQKALDYLASMRVANGAWGYGVHWGKDSPVATAWLALPHVVAHLVNQAAVREGLAPVLRQEAGLLDRLRAQLAAWTPESTGVIALGSEPRSDLTATAAALALRTLLGENPHTSPVLQKSAAFVAGRAPRWDAAKPRWDPVEQSMKAMDFESWTFGVLAAYQVGGECWRAWSESAQTIIEAQPLTGNYCGDKGSWPPLDLNGREWGRVGSTALMTTFLASLRERYERATPEPKAAPK